MGVGGRLEPVRVDVIASVSMVAATVARDLRCAICRCDIFFLVHSSEVRGSY